MLNNSDKFMLVAMKAENRCYDELIMSAIMEKLASETDEVRNAILDFWHYVSGQCGFMLYCEVMARLGGVEKQAVSYRV